MGRLAVRYWRARKGRWFIDDALLVGYDYGGQDREALQAKFKKR